MQRSFEHMLALNRPELPPMSDLPLRIIQSSPLCAFKARSDNGACLRTVEVALERETPQHWPPQAASSSSHLKALQTVAKTASGAGIAEELFIFEPADSIGTKISTIKISPIHRNKNRLVY
jgi:hypothetical protein